MAHKKQQNLFWTGLTGTVREQIYGKLVHTWLDEAKEDMSCIFMYTIFTF